MAMRFTHVFCAIPLLLAAPVSAQLSFPTRMLSVHNGERARYRLPLLRWDPALALAAASYGPALARQESLQHSPRRIRRGQAENLWMGTRGAYTPEQMVGHWLEERKDFVPGVFPSISRNGDWLAVAHYSQIIWPTTTRMGCAIYSNEKWDYLVCRYSPPGNIEGQHLP